MIVFIYLKRDSSEASELSGLHNLILPIHNRHHAHIIATHVDTEGVGFVGGDVDLGIASFAGELFPHGYRLVHAGAACRMSPSDESAGGVDGYFTLAGGVSFGNKIGTFAMFGKSQRFHGQHTGNGEIVVGFDGGQVVDGDAGIVEGFVGSVFDGFHYGEVGGILC